MPPDWRSGRRWPGAAELDESFPAESSASSLLFYLVTNTDSWLGDAGYSHDAAGWWQAMTVGHPEFPPTLYFFRNTLVSDLLFTAVFALAMEYARPPPRRTRACCGPRR